MLCPAQPCHLQCDTQQAATGRPSTGQLLSLSLMVRPRGKLIRLFKITLMNLRVFDDPAPRPGQGMAF